MTIAVTGATGFLGRYIVNHLVESGHNCRCWYRPESDRGGFDAIESKIEWVRGALGDADASETLVEGCDAVIHAAVDWNGVGRAGYRDDLIGFAETNIIGSLRLIEAAQKAQVPRFIYISSCAVHEVILGERQLDETHPLWPMNHYGAHKAAVEKFVHSFGFGKQYNICALRPTGIYGLSRPAHRSRWFTMIQKIGKRESVSVDGGGKEVHASDVAKACEILINADNVAGQCYNCYDMYISEYDVATLAKEYIGSDSEIKGDQARPIHDIETAKLRHLGMTFGGKALLEATIREIWAAAQV